MITSQSHIAFGLSPEFSQRRSNRSLPSLVMPISPNIYDDDLDDLQYMVAVTVFSDQRCLVIFVSGRISLAECSAFVQAFKAFQIPDKDLFFENHTTVRCSSEGYTLLGGMSQMLEYFRQRFEFARQATCGFTDEYTYNLHRHILRQYSMVR
jgi:hypothetical protein